MGAWDAGNFDNDDAMDWLAELEAEGLAAVDGALQSVLAGANDYLEAPTCCAGLAAAEVVAALRGKPVGRPPEALTAWVVRHAARPSAELTASARAAVEAILARSELRELWQESDEFEEWTSAVGDLARRLA